jgi:hypothetical protein
MHRHATALTARPRVRFVQPWWFGDPYFKSTGFELINLPPLVPTNKLAAGAGSDQHKAWSMIHRAAPGPDRARLRSETFPGLATAIADQWERCCSIRSNRTFSSRGGAGGMTTCAFLSSKSPGGQLGAGSAVRGRGSARGVAGISASWQGSFLACPCSRPIAGRFPPGFFRTGSASASWPRVGPPAGQFGTAVCLALVLTAAHPSPRLSTAATPSTCCAGATEWVARCAWADGWALTRDGAPTVPDGPRRAPTCRRGRPRD